MGGTKNGYYRRNLDTTLGRLEGLRVPRDRAKAAFIPNCGHPTSATRWLWRMFMQGLSVRRISGDRVAYLSYAKRS